MADFTNTYIVNDFGELRELYIAKARAIGLIIYHEIEWYDRKHLYVLMPTGILTTGTTNATTTRRQLTIKDLSNGKGTVETDN